MSAASAAGLARTIDRDLYDQDRVSYWTEPDLWDDHPGDWLSEYMTRCAPLRRDWRGAGAGAGPRRVVRLPR